MKTAAIIIIGNEILSGKTKDSNSSYLASELRGLGVDVRHISVIPDDMDVIGADVSAASGRFDYVFTAGGIGPTHDDVTMEGIANGFGVNTVVHQRLLDTINEYCGGSANESTEKMALLPEGAEIIDPEGLSFPPVVFRNVYIFPGIPEFLREKFDAIKERFRSEPFVLKKLYINSEEFLIASHLERIVEEFHNVMVGSYPKVGIPEYKVIVTLESRDKRILSDAYDRLMGLLPEGLVFRTE
jgi:molybdenum cofactor synthesis domain-containing protein